MKSNAGKAAALMSMGFELVAFVVIGYLAGRHFDEKFGWPSYGLAGGILLALVVWLTHILVVLNRYDRDEADRDSTN